MALPALRGPLKVLSEIPNEKFQCNQFKGAYISNWGFPGGSDGKAFAYNVGDTGLIPGLGRSPGEGNGNPLQYSCLENLMD